MRDIDSDNVLKQQKARAQRIDHDYHAKPHPWRTTMKWLSWVLPAIGALALGVMTFQSKGATLYEPGPVSTRHAMFNDRCEDCHVKTGNSFGVVSNEKCIACHDGPLHNERQAFNGPDKLKKVVERSGAELEVEVNTPRCASCHTEHKGNKSLQVMTDSHCTQCHMDLKVNDERPLIYKSGIDSFVRGHPDWKSLRVDAGDTPGVGKDPTPLKFNHDAHMKDPKKVHFLEKSVKGERGLKCEDCHKTDDQRRYMAPIKYDTHCAECHELKTVGEAPTPPPHGPAEAIRTAVRSQLISEKISKKEKMPATPQELNKEVEDKLGEELFLIPDKDDRPKDGTCLFCHVQNTKINSKIVIEPNIPYRWFKHSYFNHETHRVIKCEECHDRARTSKITSDVLLPGIKSCQECHKPGLARSGCNECHLYHDKVTQVQIGTLTIDGLKNRGADAVEKPAPEKKADEKKPSEVKMPDEKKPEEKK